MKLGDLLVDMISRDMSDNDILTQLQEHNITIDKDTDDDIGDSWLPTLPVADIVIPTPEEDAAEAAELAKLKAELAAETKATGDAAYTIDAKIPDTDIDTGELKSLGDNKTTNKLLKTTAKNADIIAKNDELLNKKVGNVSIRPVISELFAELKPVEVNEVMRSLASGFVPDSIKQKLTGWLSPVDGKTSKSVSPHVLNAVRRSM